MAYPVRSRGATDATRAFDAAMTPVRRPWTARRATSCSALVTNPIKRIPTAPPIVARSTISLRPNRSATTPQKGEAIAIVNA